MCEQACWGINRQGWPWGVQAWGSCKGSREGKRGYTCGLWLVLHSLAAHVAPEDSGGAFFMTSLRYVLDAVLYRPLVQMSYEG